MAEPVLTRRGFLEFWKPNPTLDNIATNATHRAPLASSLAPFVPDATHPWDAVTAGHLLRRATMMPSWADISAMVALADPGKAVDQLIAATSSPAAPSCANDATESLEGLDVVSQGIVKNRWASDAATLRTWWADVLRDAHLNLIEKMVLFWSGHFTTQFVVEESYVIAPLLYRQNQLFRSHALGNFKDMVSAITLDGAMLVYLGGNLNTTGAPNENYARELMELFTTGLGWYTETDIHEAARILTGWRVAQFTDQPAPNSIFNVYFDPAAHDVGAKVYLGASFPARDISTNTEYLVKQQEIQKLVDTLFTVRDQAIATFISKKIYRFFVYSDPAGVDMNVVSAMADLFIQNNWEIAPVMTALLKSEHFFDNANIGAQIKTPSEYVIGMARQLAPALTLDQNMTALDQQLFEPPNVSGWPGYHEWITTNTYPIRGAEAQAVISGISDSDAIAFIQQFSNYQDANALVVQIAQLLLPRPLSAARKTSFVQKLTAGAPDYEWPTILSSASTAARNFRDLLTLIVSLPDFELC